MITEGAAINAVREMGTTNEGAATVLAAPSVSKIFRTDLRPRRCSL